MSIQWAIVSFFLYAETLWVVALLLPIFSAKRWRKFFNSEVIRYIQPKANFYFKAFLGILVVFLFDAIREAVKYKEEDEIFATQKPSGLPNSFTTSPEAVKEFRAQRNLYITGMALFLWFVIKRLVVLISETADLNELSEVRAQDIIKLLSDIEVLEKNRVKKSLDDDDLDEKETVKNAELETNSLAVEVERSEKIRERSRSRDFKKEM